MPLLIALAYACTALGWILLSDQLADFVFRDDVSRGPLLIIGSLALALASAVGLYRLLFFFRGAVGLQTAYAEQSQQTRDDIIDALPDPFFMLDRDGKVLRVNSASEHAMGLSGAAMQARSCLDFVHHQDRPRVDGALRRALAGRTEEVRCQILTAHGPVPFLIRAAPTRGTDGAVTGVIGISRDISDAIRAQELVRDRTEGLQHALTQTVESMARMIEARDPYTNGHQQRVSRLSGKIARQMGLPRDLIEGLCLAASIHDLGKIAVPVELLTKPTRLSEPERQIMASHPEVAYEVLRHVDFHWPIADIVHQHHERLDGSGYPKGLLGDEILLEARILAVADVVEAMASHRPYRPGLGLDAALREISSKRGKLYDAAVVDACLAIAEQQDLCLELGPKPSGELIRG